MSDLTEEQYKKEYDEAVAKIDSAAEPAITETQEVKTEPEIKADVKVDAKEEPKVEPVTLEALQKDLEATKKALKDTQAWGTKNQQRLAEIERERLLAERERVKPAILEANPELADAIRYVASDPEPRLQQEDKAAGWRETVAKAHPGIFDATLDPELEASLMERLTALGDVISDPLVAIREITEGKLAFAERQIGKRFTIEAQKQAQKQAMSIPGQGGGVERVSVDKELAEVNRIKNMSDAEFAKEVKKAKGY